VSKEKGMALHQHFCIKRFFTYTSSVDQGKKVKKKVKKGRKGEKDPAVQKKVDWQTNFQEERGTIKPSFFNKSPQVKKFLPIFLMTLPPASTPAPGGCRDWSQIAASCLDKPTPESGLRWIPNLKWAPPVETNTRLCRTNSQRVDMKLRAYSRKPMCQ
jgi:hypothetical protein